MISMACIDAIMISSMPIVKFDAIKYLRSTIINQVDFGSHCMSYSNGRLMFDRLLSSIY